MYTNCCRVSMNSSHTFGYSVNSSVIDKTDGLEEIVIQYQKQYGYNLQCT